MSCRGLVGVLATGLVALVLPNQISWAQSQFPPLSRAKFIQPVPQGFGDRQNSYPWAMEWFAGKLFVGTGRAIFCGQAEAHNVYPPPDADVECTPDIRDLPLQAEIWSWDPATNIWSRAYQS